MSFGVSSTVPGTATAPAFMQPSRTSHHCGIRGSWTRTRSPGLTPLFWRISANLSDRSANSRKVTLRSWPSWESHHMPSLSGSLAQWPITSRAKLNRSGTFSLNVRIVSS